MSLNVYLEGRGRVLVQAELDECGVCGGLSNTCALVLDLNLTVVPRIGGLLTFAALASLLH